VKRTTLQLDDDLHKTAKSLAASEGKSLGEIVSVPARRDLSARPTLRRAVVPVFAVSKDAPALTPEMVREALDD